MIRSRLVMPFWPGEEGTALSANFKAGEFQSNHAADLHDPWYVSPLLVERLQLIRDLVGVPLKVNSGWRSPGGNAAAGGVKSSRHLIGYAADIAVTSDLKASRLAAAGYACGFRRIGLASTFVHFDVDSAPSPAVWTYDGKPAPSIATIAADAAAMFPGVNHGAL